MQSKTKQLTTASMCLALGVIMPQAFHAIPNAGNIFLPMHIPVLICGFICGPFYGLLVGLLTPFLSHIIFQMPPTFMLPQMLLELAIYGLCTGIFNKIINIKNEIVKNYVVLISSMLIGRVVYGLCNALVFKVGEYSLNIWLGAAFITSLPGILIQLVLIPIVVKTVRKLLS